MMMGSDPGANSYILMIVIWLVVIILGIWLLASLFPKTTSKPADRLDDRKSDSTGSDLQILNRQYARGEISKEQYEEMRHELEL